VATEVAHTGHEVWNRAFATIRRLVRIEVVGAQEDCDERRTEGR
jgi:hypothetical protein